MACPDENTLLAFSDGGLSTVARDRVELHLDSCVLCAALVADAVRSQTGRLPSLASVRERNPERLPGPGDTLADRYRLGARIGAGGMGVVMSARDETLNRRVAVKLLRPGKQRPNASERLVREARAMARLAHPNVVEVFEVGAIDDGTLFVVMELVEGSTLRDWLESGQRSRSAIADVVFQAGRGLEAAHRVGVVHRDFKPDNVLVSDLGGRPVAKVLDFGLARLADEPSVETPADTARAESSASGSLTVSGTVMGTPLYMAPEQHTGAEADPRSDQFAFCCTLYEALCGVRPYRGTKMLELAQRKTAGAIEPPLQGRALPRPLARVVLRGLAADPHARWPDMTALLVALQAARAPHKARWAVAGAGAVALVGAVAAGGRSPEPSCAEMSRELDAVWNDTTKSAIATAFSSTEISYASDTADRVIAELDAWTGSWAEARAQTCEALRDEEHNTAARLDQRQHCLREAAADLEALIDVLSEPDTHTVERATSTVASLPDPSRCEAAGDGSRRPTTPDDARMAQAVAGIRGRLHHVRALDGSARYAEALPLAEASLRDARAVGWDPVIAEAALALGKIQKRSGDTETAAATLQEAHWLAAAAGDDAVAADAATFLVFVVGYDLARPGDGMVWARHARTALDRLPGKADDAELLAAIGTLHFRKGDTQNAVSNFRAALQAREHAHGADHPRVVSDLNNLGSTLAAAGRYDEAKPLLQRARDIATRVHGPRHPTVSNALYTLATVAQLEHRYDESYQQFSEALAIREDAYGDTHPDLASLLNNLGSVAQARGDLDEARRHFERALAIRERLHPGHPDAALPHNNLGYLLRDQGDHEAAYRHHEQARILSSQAYGDDHPDVAYALQGMGAARLAQDRAAEAVAHLERALEIRRAAGARPDELGDTAFALARALWPQEQSRPRSLELAELARASYSDAGQAFDEQRTEIETWIDDHRP